MMLRNVKPGTRVLVYMDGEQLSPGPNVFTYQVPAFVVRHHGNGGTTLGWNKSDKYPTKYGSPQSPIAGDVVQADILLSYGDHCMCEYIPFNHLLEDMSINPAVALKERRCKQCGIMNDMSAKKCYYCETLNPTD
jgi:hypothetical protein